MITQQIRVTVGAIMLLALFWFAPQLMAASIPTVSPPEGGSDDIIAAIWSFGKLILRILFMFFAVAMTLVLVGSGISSYSNVRKTGEWGGFVLTLAVGIFITVAVWFLAGMGAEMLDGAI